MSHRWCSGRLGGHSPRASPWVSGVARYSPTGAPFPAGIERAKRRTGGALVDWATSPRASPWVSGCCKVRPYRGAFSSRNRTREMSHRWCSGRLGGHSPRASPWALIGRASARQWSDTRLRYVWYSPLVTTAQLVQAATRLDRSTVRDPSCRIRRTTVKIRRTTGRFFAEPSISANCPFHAH
jgi:hypothetical protein